jgi:hypothetical protein
MGSVLQLEASVLVSLPSDSFVVNHDCITYMELGNAKMGCSPMVRSS